MEVALLEKESILENCQLIMNTLKVGSSPCLITHIPKHSTLHLVDAKDTAGDRETIWSCKEMYYILKHPLWVLIELWRVLSSVSDLPPQLSNFASGFQKPYISMWISWGGCSVLMPSSGSCYVYRTALWPISSYTVLHCSLLNWDCPMWPFEHYSGTVASVMASRHKAGQPSYPDQRSLVFFPAILCPLPLRGFGILSCFLWIILMYTRSSEVVIQFNFLGHLTSSLLLNYSHILVGMVTFNIDFSRSHAGSLRLYFWKLCILQMYLSILKQTLNF